jgi:hypothetical protein
MGFNGGIIKPPKKRKKSKLQKCLEEGDLLFNLVMSVWFLFLVFLFKGVFKLVLPYKTSVFVFNFVVAGFIINLIFKIVDIYAEYTKETLAERIQKEILEKRKIKPLP